MVRLKLLEKFTKGLNYNWIVLCRVRISYQGEGIIIKICEIKFGKWMHHVGHQVKMAQKVFGIEHKSEKGCILAWVEDRSTETLIQIKVKYTHPG